MLDIALCRQALQWSARGQRVAVAVVLSTWRSAPRPVGSRLFVREDGEFIGSVSGGCIESEVITAAAEVNAGGKAQRLTFGVADESAWEVGLSCGGTIALLVYPLTAAAADCLETALSRLAARQPSVLFTAAAADSFCCLQDEHQAILCGDAAAAAAPGAAAFSLSAAAAEHDGVFVEPLPPPPRLLIIGATHITQFLLQQARDVDFAAVVIDPRQRWASTVRFPHTTVRVQWPDEALDELGIDRQDAVITLTHDAKIDDPALLAALAATPFYIGALGSRRTHTKRLERLSLAAETADRIHAPIGLNLGAQSAAEIALSVMAQVVQVYHRERDT